MSSSRMSQCIESAVAGYGAVVVRVWDEVDGAAVVAVDVAVRPGARADGRLGPDLRGSWMRGKIFTTARRPSSRLSKGYLSVKVTVLSSLAATESMNSRKAP